MSARADVETRPARGAVLRRQNGGQRDVTSALLSALPGSVAPPADRVDWLMIDPVWSLRTGRSGRGSAGSHHTPTSGSSR